MIQNFEEFLKILHQKDELLTISRFVDPNMEIAELTDRQMAQPHGGKALLFENNGTNFPVVTNIFSSEKRIALVFDMDNLDDVCTRISGFFQAFSQTLTNSRFMRKSPLAELTQYIPKNSNSGSCQEIALFPPDLNRIPFLRNREFDEAHSLHDVPMIIKNPYLNTYSVESTRLMWHSKTTIQVRFEPGSQAASFINESPQGRIPVALLLGGDPLYTLTGIIPRSSDIDPLLLGGYLRKKAMVKVPCLSQPLEVPENCDLVIEGYIDKNAQLLTAAACGENTGFYSLGGKEPLIHVTCITHKKNAVLPLIIPGIGLVRSKNNLCKTISAFVETNFEQTVALEVRKLCLPCYSYPIAVAVVSIRKFYPGQTHKVAHGFWGSPLTALNKLLIIVDETVDVYNRYEVNECIRQYYSPSRDTFFSRGPLSINDHASPQRGFGGKMCIDATKKTIPYTHVPSSSPDPCQFYHKSEGNPLENRSDARILVAVDEEIDTDNRELCLWMAINQADPVRDVRIENGILYVDACIKRKGDKGITRPWPNVCCSSPETIRNVDKYWDRLKIGHSVISPSLKIQRLLREGNAQVKE